MTEKVLVPREFIEFVRTAPVSSGVCCCGEIKNVWPEWSEWMEALTLV